MATPRRSLRGDLLAALAAISLLALAVIFAVVLTADTLQTAQETQTATAESMAPTQAATGTPTLVITQIAPTTAAPKASATSTSPATPTEASTEAASPDASASPDAPASPNGAGSPTGTATKSVTRAPATTRPTPTPSPTRRPPTATASPTLRPTNTSTPTPTNTLLPSPTFTATPLPTDTPISTATLTSKPPATSTPTPQETGGCVFPADWQPYTIQSGDNLFRLSIRAGVSTTELQQANCIPNAASIRTGQVIYVPPAFFNIVPAATTSGSTGGVDTSGPGAPPGQTEVYPLRLGCLLPQVQINSPAPNSLITARTTIYGAATLSDTSIFNFYKLELRGLDGVYRNLSQSSSPAQGPSSLLGLLDPARFAPGEYQLVLTVVEQSGNFPEPCAIRIYLGR